MEKGVSCHLRETRNPKRDQAGEESLTPTTAISSSSPSTHPHPDLSSSPAWDPSPLWISIVEASPCTCRSHTFLKTPS